MIEVHLTHYIGFGKSLIEANKMADCNMVARTNAKINNNVK